MPDKAIDKGVQRLILQAEIAALLHDIGKFTKEFIKDKVGSGPKFNHAWGFLEGKSTACKDQLKNILNRNMPEGWLEIPNQSVQLKTLGDLARLHHAGNNQLKEQLGWCSGKDNIPHLIAMIMIADSIDSSTSKGGAVFNAKRRSPRLEEANFEQHIDTCY